MMKWFRAHTKQIMVVVVLLAMFSFVGGSALVTFLQPDPAKAPYGEAFGKEFTQGAIGEAQRDVNAMETVFGFGTPEEYRRQYGTVWQFGRKDLSFVHWYLLALEAERAGIEVSDQEIDEQFQNFPPDFMEQLRTRFRIIPAELRRAIRRQLSIEKNGRRVSSAAVPSEAQVRHYVKETEEKVKVRFVALDAEKLIDEKDLVSADEVAAHFEKFKDLDPAKSEDGYGYRYPPRVKLQYIVAQIPLIAPGVEISQEAIRSTWKANKAKYKKVIYVDPPTSAPATSAPTIGPTSQPEKPKPVPQTVEKSYSEAQADVERELRQKAAQQAADQALRKIQTHLQRPWLDEKTDPKTGFKPVPEAAKDAEAMKSAYERFAAEFKIPLEYGETPLVTKVELAKMKVISGAMLEGGKGAAGAGESLRIDEFAFRVPPLFEHSEGTETLPSLQLFQVPDLPLTVSSYQFAGGAFESTVQKFVLFRVVEARESAAPAALDEVRAAVERDVRKMKAFKRAEPTARELFAAGRRLGLEPAFGLFTDLREKQGAALSTPPPFARLAKQTDPRLREKILSDEPTTEPPNVPGVGVSKPFVEACFEMTADDWRPPPMEAPKSERIDAATTRPAVAPSPKVRIVGLPAQKKWLVVELIGTEPVDDGQYQSKYRQTAYYGLMSERNLALRDEWYKPEHIEKRCGFRRIAPEGELAPIEGVSRPPPTPYF